VDILKVAHVRTRGHRFALVEVPDELIDDQQRVDELIADAVFAFDCPTVLVGAEGKRTYGRPQLVGLIKYLPLSRFSWATITWAGKLTPMSGHVGPYRKAGFMLPPDGRTRAPRPAELALSA
jgi:hypothetical protein